MQEESTSFSDFYHFHDTIRSLVSHGKICTVKAGPFVMFQREHQELKRSAFSEGRVASITLNSKLSPEQEALDERLASSSEAPTANGLYLSQDDADPLLNFPVSLFAYITPSFRRVTKSACYTTVNKSV